MKILIYTHELVPWRGGVATYNYELAMGLSELGQEVIVLAPRYSDKDILSDAKMPFKVIRVALHLKSAMRLNRNIIKLPGSVRCFIETQQQYKPDRILITSAVSHESTAIARLFSPFTFTLTVHGTEVYMHFVGRLVKQWSKSRLMHWFFNKADSIICVSNSTKHLLEQNTNLRNKTSVVYCGIDPNDFLLNDDPEDLFKRFNLLNQKIILTVARLGVGKGQDVVIRALPKVLEEIPNTKYLVVGDGPKRPALETLAKKMGLEQSVLFVGSVDRERIGSFYDACDIFVMVSRRGKRESFGIVYLEAWAYEKPVIGGNAGGVGEVIEHGRTGLLVDPSDVNAVAEAMCRLLRYEDLAKAMGKAGRKRVEELFSRKSMARKTLGLL